MNNHSCVNVLGLGIFRNLTNKFYIFTFFFYSFIIIIVHKPPFQERLPQLIGIEYNS